MMDRILGFLQSRSWQLLDLNGKFFELIPPAELNLPEDFKLHIPASTTSDSHIFIDNLLEIISGFYSLTKDDLNIILKDENTILKVRIYDEHTQGGKIALLRFEGLIEKIKAILSDTASFVIDKSVTSTRVPQEVHRYLNLCNFLQTEKGSFVANIQLPSKELIKDKELFDNNEVFSYHINNKLSEVLSFVNENILEGNVDASGDYLLANEDKINIKLLRHIEAFYDEANLKNIDFSFHSLSDSSTIVNKEITKLKLSKLTEFVAQIESQAFEVGVITVRGRITTLKSKDPDGLKNNVVFSGLFNEMPYIATANLSSDHYKEAIEAHKIKQSITISGLVKRTKTRIRFIEINSFNSVD